MRGIFGRIAPRYDLMNRLMTFGQDVRWRREVIRRAKLAPGGCLLDLGAGTGDLARETLRQVPTARVTAADFTLEMMRVGRKRPGAAGFSWAAADALHLPFTGACYDALVSGYLLRNVADLDRALSEQLRVLKPGGWMVTLDTTRPVRNLLSPLIHIHMHFVIPLLGTLLTGQRDAYTYLPDTSENFLSAEALADRMTRAGFENVGFHRFNFGTMAIHWGRKPLAVSH
ncbi:demethylmenaquinone methyltransferase [Longilinea arvoryzae]|uniref:Demethylmenaquinone methyltransferase n=1 Tax=Longilinea arvoryzae TaxID=360412 RepID=A0A0S7BG83_9CHLR|nr:demethylmenaquinone methyltransferase [Longilinea arvoryzae]